MDVESAAAERAPLPEPPLGTPGEFAAIALGSALAAHAVVWLGYAWRDGGPTGAYAQVLAKQLFLTQGWWRLPAAALMGALLHRFYVRLLAAGAYESKAGPVLWGIPRAFIHFALYGMIALFGIMLAGAVMFVQALRRRRSGEPAPSEEQQVNLMARWLGVPVWFILLPFTVAGLPNEGDMTLPVTVARRALLRWLPAIGLCLLMWTGMVSEDSGEPPDPRWLSAFASYWVAEFMLVALRVTPILRARRGLTP
jgi:hypothetical protein